MEAFMTILRILAGLSLFLYGVSRLSESLQQLAGKKINNIVERFTKNRFAGVATGAVATTLLDSSSITIIMVISLVNSGILSFVNSLGVVMGANIGTTISSQLIAFQINEYAALLLVVGLLFYTLGKGKKIGNLGLVIFGFGLIFFGLEIIGDAAAPLKENKMFIGWISKLDNPWSGVLVGAIFTVLIQSSSATIGIVITLASQGMITLPLGISIMLGAEIGTCADTLVATVGGSRNAVRTGIFHLGFNIITVVIGVFLADYLAIAARKLASGENISRQIANAHMIFNFMGVLLFIWFVPFMVKFLEWIVPDRKTDQVAEAVEG